MDEGDHDPILDQQVPWPERTGNVVKIVVVGGTGLIGARLTDAIRQHGDAAVPASPATGVNTVTGEGMEEALTGADVVVDVSNSPSFAPEEVLAFFETSTRHLLEAEALSGVRHHVALSVVGTDRLLESGYFRAKLAQERLIEDSLIPYSIVRATQFFEFIDGIAHASTDGDTVRVPPALIQPMAADDVVAGLETIVTGTPTNARVELGGPEQFRLDQLIRRMLTSSEDTREVVADPTALYFGAQLGERTLLPGTEAWLGSTRLSDWMKGL
jgi:uncharacterized protein YbjT (DUF2867 family)